MTSVQLKAPLKTNASRRNSIAAYNSPPESPIKKKSLPATNKDDNMHTINVPPELKSKEYWFYDGNLLLTCDDLWFLVHQSVLSRISNKFKDVITELLAVGNPNISLKIPGNGKSWSTFLSMVYPSCDGEERERLTREEWFIIYDVARDYKFEGIRRVAFTEITLHVDKFIELIKMGRNQFSEMPEWCIQGFKGLCEREEPLTLEEAKELGLEDTVKIAEAREKLLRGFSWEDIVERFMW